MEIGEILKEAREARDLTLDNVQEATKIQKRYLLAIERGDFHILPGKFYARAFIKEYAHAVGLDPEELLTEHKEEIPSPEEKDTNEYSRTRRSRQSNRPNKSSAIFSFIPTVIVVLLVIGIFFVAWTLYQKNANNSADEPVDDIDSGSIIRDADEGADPDSTSPVDEEEKDSEDPEDMESTDQPEFSVVELGTGNSPESTMELNNVGEDIHVSLIFTGETYIQVLNGSEEVLLDGMFSESNSPQELDLTGEERVYFNVGYSLNTSIIINETELEYLIDPESSVHQKIWINFNKTE